MKVCVHPVVPVSVNVTVNVAPPPAVPGPKVNCTAPYGILLLGVIVVPPFTVAL